MPLALADKFVSLESAVATKPFSEAVADGLGGPGDHHEPTQCHRQVELDGGHSAEDAMGRERLLRPDSKRREGSTLPSSS